MPSLGGEVFGLVALENMMRGKLVVVSDIGALVEVVGDAGLTCPVGDVDAWASCMERLIQNPELCWEWGQRARERAQKLFSIQQMIAGHMDVYSRVLEKAR
jgi:glycosyltransferase involved in cell wall biosynthesis